MNPELIALLKQIRDTWGRETVQAIINKIDQEGINWQGTLRRSISYEQLSNLDGDIKFYMADYGEFVDKGVNGLRSAYTTPYKFSGNPEKIKKMGGALKPWADSKGLNAWAVAWTIQRKGLKPRRFFSSVIEQRIDALGLSIVQAISSQLDSSVARYNSN